MWRRLNREDLVGSNPLLIERSLTRRKFIWLVYENYELIEPDGEEPYFLAEPPELKYWKAGNNHFVLEHWSGPEPYVPLMDTPYLFLEFARLHESKDVDGAIYDWIRKYGLLGLSQDELPPDHIWNPFGTPGLTKGTGVEGGPEETLPRFRKEVQTANSLLRLYEAALSKDVDMLERTLQIDSAATDGHSAREHFRSSAKLFGSTYLDVLVDEALDAVSVGIMNVLGAYSYPSLVCQSSPESRPIREFWSPERMLPSLGAKNLLGAMYIQFYWLVSSGGDLSRCKQCRRIISYTPPSPERGDRKTRKDKKFCSNACRQKYHYYNVIKPNR